MKGGPVRRGIDPLLDNTGNPNDTNPWVHTCFNHINGRPINLKNTINHTCSTRAKRTICSGKSSRT